MLHLTFEIMNIKTICVTSAKNIHGHILYLCGFNLIKVGSKMLIP